MPTRQQSALGRLILAGLAVLTIVAGWARYSNAKRRTTTSKIPPFSTLPAHFAPPIKSRWGRGSRAPYPTGASWLNAALGDVPVPATPYQVAITPKGAQLSYGFKRRRATSEAQLDPFGVDWFVQPVSDGSDAATAAADAASRVKHVENEAGGFVAAGDALYGASHRTTNATLERRSPGGAAYDGRITLTLNSLLSQCRRLRAPSPALARGRRPSAGVAVAHAVY